VPRVRRVVHLSTVAALDYSVSDERELAVAIDQARHPMSTVFLPVWAIDESPGARNSRRTYDETRLNELAASITENGVLQPILVTPIEADRYQVIAGNRRLKAAMRAGLDRIPAIVKQHVDETTRSIWNLVENIQRVDLSAKERVEAIRQLASLGLGVRDISRRTGLTPATISKWVRLAEKPIVMQALETGRIDIFRAMQLVPLKDPVQQEALLAQAPGLSKQEFSAAAQQLASGQPAFCVDDGRLADIDRELALVRHVTPIGLDHLRRIIATAAALVASADGDVAVRELSTIAEVTAPERDRVSVSPGKHVRASNSQLVYNEAAKREGEQRIIETQPRLRHTRGADATR
jgi:ParB/RepB/Spo0J family partition protein